MRRRDDAHPLPALLLGDLAMELVHFRPVHFGPEMMLGVVTVIEPKPVVELVITADAPGDRLVGVTPEMEVVAVEVGKTMAQIIERQEEDDEVPIQKAEQNEDVTFGSSAIFELKIRCFLPPPRGGFSFVGLQYCDLYFK